MLSNTFSSYLAKRGQATKRLIDVQSPQLIRKYVRVLMGMYWVPSLLLKSSTAIGSDSGEESNLGLPFPFSEKNSRRAGFGALALGPGIGSKAASE